MNLAIVGAGSTYTPELVDGLVRMRDLLPVEELTLLDTDEERLRILGAPCTTAGSATRGSASSRRRSSRPAADGDAAARGLVERLAGEIALLVARGFRDLELDAADVVLGGGMLRRGEGLLHDEVVARLPARARPVVLRHPPVLGAALAALDAAGASDAAKARLREELRAG
jgi:hypothetical protein